MRKWHNIPIAFVLLIIIIGSSAGCVPAPPGTAQVTRTQSDVESNTERNLSSEGRQSTQDEQLRLYHVSLCWSGDLDPFVDFTDGTMLIVQNSETVQLRDMGYSIYDQNGRELPDVQRLLAMEWTSNSEVLIWPENNLEEGIFTLVFDSNYYDIQLGFCYGRAGSIYVDSEDLILGFEFSVQNAGSALFMNNHQSSIVLQDNAATVWTTESRNRGLYDANSRVFAGLNEDNQIVLSTSNDLTPFVIWYFVIPEADYHYTYLIVASALDSVLRYDPIDDKLTLHPISELDSYCYWIMSPIAPPVVDASLEAVLPELQQRGYPVAGMPESIRVRIAESIVRARNSNYFNESGIVVDSSLRWWIHLHFPSNFAIGSLLYVDQKFYWLDNTLGTNSDESIARLAQTATLELGEWATYTMGAGFVLHMFADRAREVPLGQVVAAVGGDGMDYIIVHRGALNENPNDVWVLSASGN